MTSKLVVNTIEADTGISSVSFASSISLSSTSVFHLGDAGFNIGADTNINRPAAGVIGFNINSSEKVRIDSSGHIKIVGVCTATHFYGNGSNLTSLPAANLTGALPAISGANLTGLATTEDVNNLINNVAMLGFKVAVNGSLARYNLVDQVIDEFNDASGIDAGASTNEVLGGSGNAKYYSGSATSNSNTTQTYAYTGSDVTLALNNGQTVTGTVKLWGAAGGTDYSPGNANHRGGAGAFASAVFDFTSDGTDLIFSVGQGGISGTKAGSGGNGGGYTGVFLGSKTHGNALMIAGAGGGAGDTAGYNGTAGGAFGASANGAYTGGGGGQQGAGGSSPGNPFGGATVLPTAGSALTGGHGGGNQARSQSAAYNGGGIQGQEPGGYQGGGGGGAGYYGGGGGAGGNGGSGGGGGSSWYNTGSYWSGTPTSTAGNDNGTAAGGGGTSGGASDSNYPGGGVGSVTAGSRNNGGNGAIYVNINVGTVSYNNMTLQSIDATASSAPSTADLIMMIENSAGTATLNTDIKAYISRDSGANFTQGTLVDEGSWGTSTKRILAFHNLDISGQPSGTAVCYKITTHNQSASKSTRIHAVSHGWK